VNGYVGTVKLYAGTRAAPQYVVSRQEKGYPELLRISLRAAEEKALPVFSSEELARGFLRSGDLGSEWYVNESRNGELVSLVLGPYTDVRWVLPNPLPEPLAAEDALLNLPDRGASWPFSWLWDALRADKLLPTDDSEGPRPVLVT
jgi:hypothetical protein